MKKNDFENRLQNDLFPDLPRSFERKMKQALENEGVKVKKRPTATGVFAGAVSVVAAAACLAIILMGVLGGGDSKTNAAASQEPTARMAQPTPGPGEWKGDTKVIALSDGFNFENTEKYEALYQGILRYLMIQGEEEPDELWLCAIKPRRVGESSLDGYFVLAKHAFGTNEGPELYCVRENGDVLWCTKGSGQGPNHAVYSAEDSYTELHQRHFLYGTEPMIAEPGIPHVKRGAVLGQEPGTDVEFSMAASITDVQNRLDAAGSAYPGAAREFFLVTMSAADWEYAMEAHTLRFETEEGPVDVNMEKELPEAKVVMGPQPSSDAENRERQGVEYWLSQNQPIILDLTDDWDGQEIVQQYGQAVARALRVSGEHIASEGVWMCGVLFDMEKEDGSLPDTAYILAQYAFDGDTGPELFYYNHGAIEWMTRGCDSERINVVYHNGNTVVFGRSPAFDGEPLPMSYGKIVLKDGGSDQVAPVLALDEIRERITGGPHDYSARECFLWTDGAEHEVSKLTVAARIDGDDREYALNKVNVLTPQPVPAMAVETGGVIYPGTVTVLIQSLTEDGVTAEGEPLLEALKGMSFPEQRIVWTRPLNILTASEGVSVGTVEVFTGDLTSMLYNDADIDVINELPAGDYILCFNTNTLGPYSEEAGRYTFTNEYTIYRVTLE